MPRPRFVSAAVFLALCLPIAICVLLGTARLLEAMDDIVGAAVLNRIALASGILWVLSLISLLLLLGTGAVAENQRNRTDVD